MSEEQVHKVDLITKAMSSLPQIITAASANPMGGFALLAIITVLLFLKSSEANQIIAFLGLLVVFLILTGRLTRRAEKTSPHHQEAAPQGGSRAKAMLAADHVFQRITAYDASFAPRWRPVIITIAIGAMIGFLSQDWKEGLESSLILQILYSANSAVVGYIRRGSISRRLRRGGIDFERLAGMIESHARKKASHKPLFQRMVADS